MNDWDKARGHPCDSEEWFFKMLGAPEFKFAWKALEKKESDADIPPCS